MMGALSVPNRLVAIIAVFFVWCSLESAHAKSELAPLAAASALCDVGEVRRLIQSGADINKVGTGQSTALKVAANLNCVPVVSLLIESGADVDLSHKASLFGSYARKSANYDRGSALYFATAGGHTDIVEVLLKAGANPDQESRLIYDRNPFHRFGGYTMLAVAAYNGHSGALKMLLSYGADVNKPGRGSLTPLMASVVHDQSKNKKWVCFLLVLEAGGDLNFATPRGERFHPEDQNMTALMLAAHWLRYEESAVLTALGADVEVTTELGETAAMAANASVARKPDKKFEYELVQAALGDEKWAWEAAVFYLSEHIKKTHDTDEIQLMNAIASRLGPYEVAD